MVGHPNGDVGASKLRGDKIDYKKWGYSCEEDLIKDLEGAAAAYGNDLKYSIYPPLQGGFNSNGYIHGIIKSLGISVGQNPGDGWNQVVPINYTPKYKEK